MLQSIKGVLLSIPGSPPTPFTRPCTSRSATGTLRPQLRSPNDPSNSIAHEVTQIPNNPLNWTMYSQISHWHAKNTREPNTGRCSLWTFIRETAKWIKDPKPKEHKAGVGASRRVGRSRRRIGGRVGVVGVCSSCPLEVAGKDSPC